jgi:membrane protein
MNQLEKAIRASKPVQWLITRLKAVFLPGFEGVSLFHSLNFFRKEIFSNRFYTKASAIAFSFIMALPPLMLFFFTLVPYLPLPENRIMAVINQLILLFSPNEDIKRSVLDMVYNFINHKKNVLLSFSVLLTLYYASNGMMGLMHTFQRRDPGFKDRHWLRSRGIAIGLTVLLIVTSLLPLTLILLQFWFATQFEWAFMQNSAYVQVFVYLLIVLTLLLSMSFIYHFGASTVSRLHLISPGAIITTFLIIVITQIFFYAVNHLVNYDKIYGSIGTLIIFLGWIHLIAQVILIGFELNVSIIVHKKQKPDTL